MKLYTHHHKKNGKVYPTYSISIPKRLVDSNELAKFQGLEWEQGPKGTLVLKPKK